FGAIPAVGWLSFPRPGVTLALDFPNQGPATFRLLESLDAVVATTGGAVYPAKDARMSGIRFREFFPQWPHFRAYIDPRFSSSVWRRVMEE
ncbi:MAG: FAD-binding protein, partial [Candidatus Competibacter denitrificans]